MKNKEYIIFGTLLIAIVMGSFIIGYETRKFKVYHYGDERLQTLYEINEKGCNNLSLEQTAYCMVNEIKPYFSYMETNDSIKLTFEELKELGGDCRDWSLLFNEQTPEDYYGEYVAIQTEKRIGHAFYILSNEEGYCLLDQVETPYCTRFKKV